MPGSTLSDSLGEIVVKMAKEYLYTRRERTLSTAPRDEMPQAPEVYVVRTPAEGIVSLLAYTDYGTGTGTGTGTGSLAPSPTSRGNLGVIPGFAYCTVCQSEAHVQEITEIVPVTNFTLKVHNLSPLPVAGGVYVIAVRDKWGDWWIPWPGWAFGEC